MTLPPLIDRTREGLRNGPKSHDWREVELRCESVLARRHPDAYRRPLQAPSQGALALRGPEQPEVRQALPLLSAQTEICACSASHLQFHVAMISLSTAPFETFQPPWLQSVFDFEVTTEASFAKASSPLMHFGCYDLLAGPLAEGERGGHLSP